MRQAEDQRYAEAMRRIRIHESSLMITKNLNYLPVSLINEAIVEFYEFCESTMAGINSSIIELSQYMLIRLQRNADEVIQISGLSANVVPIWSESFKYNSE